MLSLTKIPNDATSSINSVPFNLANFAFSPVTAVMDTVLLPRDLIPVIQKSPRSPVFNKCVPQHGSLEVEDFLMFVHNNHSIRYYPSHVQEMWKTR